jgi:murein DD-endopeptidase MepM/ murein hydrolase activator NlpD
MSPKRRIFPWQRGEDGFSPLDRLGHRIASSSLWIRFSAPAGIALALVAVGLGAYGIFTLATSGKDEQPSAVIVRVVTPTAQPAATAAASLPPAQVLEQPITVEVLRSSTFVWPAAGRLTRADAAGLTIALGVDPAVKASSQGVVSEAGSNVVSIDHEGGMSSRYFNLAGVAVTSGQRVQKGEVIGWGASSAQGSIGPVRFELRSGSQLLDPRLYLPSTHADPATVKAEVVVCPAASIVVDPASTVNLVLSSDELRLQRIQRVVVVPKAPDARGITARPRGDLGVMMEVEPAKAASSQAQEYALDFTFSSVSGSTTRTVSCQVSLVTPNSIPADGLDAVVASPTEEVAAPPPIPPPATTTTPTASPTQTRTPTPAATSAGTTTAGTTTIVPSSTPGTRTPVSATSTPARTSTVSP